MRWPFILAVVLITSSALADITGPATVVDGDTIKIDGTSIRLHGIDAPETRSGVGRDNRRHGENNRRGVFG